MAHIREDVLERYAMGKLPDAAVPNVEEHLLLCVTCQERLSEADEFVAVFRTAATHVMAHPTRWWRRIPSVPGLAWAGAAAVAVLFVALGGISHRTNGAPATVVMHAMRGPESTARVPAGRSAVLVFPGVAAEAGRYDVQIVNPDGDTVAQADAQIVDGRTTLTADRLARGRYWVRLYRKHGRELIAEYGLRAE
jgi:hypothetical protein